MELHMHRDTISFLAAVAWLAASGLGCSEASGPTDANLAQMATKRGPTLTPQTSGTTARLIGVHAVNQNVAWVSGVDGTFAVTTDGGATWNAGVVPGAEALQFRDVEGVSATEAYLLSIGFGSDARIYHTTDGGESWDLQFQNADPDAFYDCFAFWTPNRGFAYSDGVNGRFPVIRTTDGETWQDIGDNLPTAQPGETSFASSGTCTAAQGGKRGWIGTGGWATRASSRPPTAATAGWLSRRRSCRAPRRERQGSSPSTSAVRTAASWPAATSSARARCSRTSRGPVTAGPRGSLRRLSPSVPCSD
jgi:photosystem II stability/assembly factor-like uncharacterized protein